MHGSECWAVTKRDVLKIDALDQWYLQGKSVRNQMFHHVQNDKVIQITKKRKLFAIVQAQRLSMFGHIARMPGKADTTWMKTIKQDLAVLSLNEAIDMAQNHPLRRLMTAFGTTGMHS